jgi:O-antigen ligase
VSVRRITALLGWGMLGAWPIAGVALLAPFGLVGLVRGLVRPGVLVALGVLTVTVVGATLTAPATVDGRPTWIALDTVALDPSDNLLSHEHLRALSGARGTRPAYAAASRDPDTGGWTVPLRDAATGDALTRVRSPLTVPVTPGVTYTTVLHLDGDPPGLVVRVATDAGTVDATLTRVGSSTGQTVLTATWSAPDGASEAAPLDLELVEGSTDAITIAMAAVFPEGATAVDLPLAPSDVSLREALVGWGARLLTALLALGAGAWTRRRGLQVFAAAALVAGMAVQAGVALSQALAGSGRGAGFAPHPNFLGHEAVVAAALAFALAGPRVAWWGALVAAVVVAATGSRSAALGLAGVIAVLVARWLVDRGRRTPAESRRAPRWKATALGVLGAVALAATIVGALAVRGDNLLSDRNLRERLDTWGVAWQAVTEYPFTGVGFGRFDAYAQDHRPAFGMVRTAPHAHTLALSLLSEMGWPAALALVAVWVVAVRGQRDRGLARAFVTFLALFVVLTLLDMSLFWTPVYVMVWLATGVVGSRHQPVRASGPVR